jgi:hypothetical protein
MRMIQSGGSFSTNDLIAVDYAIDTGTGTAVIPALGDVTGDGWTDLLVLLSGGMIRLYPHQGEAGQPFNESVYTNSWAGVLASGGTGLAMADINFDGNLDLLVSDTDGRIWEYHGDGVGGYVLDSKVWGGSYAGFADHLTIAAGDVDGDGDVDAVLGSAAGGLTYLRDPRIGVPFGLAAFGGAGSIRLTWVPNRNYQLKGYYVYRSTALNGPFSRITPEPIVTSIYTDSDVLGGAIYYYYVTAVSEGTIPGSTVPREFESPESKTVYAEVDFVRLWMPDVTVPAGGETVVQVNIDYGTGVAGEGMVIRMAYDPSWMTPVSQVSTNPTVRKTSLTETLVVSNNSDIASGELTILGTGGAVIGSGHLFDVYFNVATNAPAGLILSNSFSSAMLFGEHGAVLSVDASDIAEITVGSAAYYRGDLNGDGFVDQGDHHHLMWLLQKNTRDPNLEEISAGDLNGNGMLDHRDISLLMRLINDQ